MLLKKYVYTQLLNCSAVPPETGGILGMTDNIIDVVAFDNGISTNSCIYSPDISVLNNIISKWEEEGIIFSGMFHTHILKWSELSINDKKYIERILIAMPITINELYFPLVFPNNFIKGYVAYKIDNKVCISEDDIKIV
jgi:hypothetical protein